MSRIGRSPIALPAGVELAVRDGVVNVKGPKGSLTEPLVQFVDVMIDGQTVTVQRTKEHKQAKSNHGLMRALIANMVTGVTTGFAKDLEIIGVGYRADVKGSKLVLNLGYSHPIEYAIPDGIQIAADKSGKIKVSGTDKQQVGQVAAVIRSFREPDSYKGKGVRYVGEYIRLKAGKSGK